MHPTASTSTSSTTWPTWPSTTKTSTARAQLRPQTGCASKFESADALLLVTPEYNGSIPASLKNAIDWISRPHGAGVISGKPLAVIGVSNGRYGGVWAHDDARKVASIAGASVLDDVTLSVPHGATRFATTHPAHDDEIAHAMPSILAALAAVVQNSRTGG